MLSDARRIFAALVNVDFHHGRRSSSGPLIEWAGLVWSHASLQRPNFSRPLRPAYDPLNPRPLPHEAAAVRTDHLIRRGATAQADLSAEDEARLYDQLGDPERHPIVLLEVPGERAGEPGLEELPALTLGDLAAWTYELALVPTAAEIETGLAQPNATG
jgi:hypothetical protein